MRVFDAEPGALALRELQGCVRAGDDLRAMVEVSGGEHGIQLEALMLRLEEERVDFEHPRHGGFSFWREHAAVMLPLPGRALAPGERLSLPLTLKLPADLEPSAPHRRYRVTAKVKARSRHPSANALVDVVDAAG